MPNPGEDSSAINAKPPTNNRMPANWGEASASTRSKAQLGPINFGVSGS